MVVAAGQDELEAGRALGQADALEEAEVGEQGERSVHTGGADRLAALAEALGDCVGIDAAALVGQQLDHGLASPAGPVAFTAEDLADALAPGIAFPRRRTWRSLGRSGHGAMIVVSKR
jgi:hypothetical protein